MRIKITSFMGRFGFEVRRKFPKTSSWLYLNSQAFLRKNATKIYIEKVMQEPQKMLPIFVNIETINRCNGTCAFCPANSRDESRELKKMPLELFEKIIGDLEKVQYAGILSLYMNNEPFIDERMEDMLIYARKRLSNAKILVFTNGTLLTPDRFKKIEQYIHYMFINNYSKRYEMNKPVKVLYEYVKRHDNGKKPDITVQLRYVGEYLTNRAGTAPNKQRMDKIYKWQCLMPYTDINIYPDGKVGICCNDTKEVTDYGNVWEHDLIEIFRNEKFAMLRKRMREGRNECEFCRYCDVVDSGIRLRFIREHRV